MSGRPLIFGEVLFDRFPDGSEVLGGAPFNVAWNLCGFGLAPLLVSRVGRDTRGDRILAAMEEFGLDTSGVQRDEVRPTGTVEITLHGNDALYEIVSDRAYDAIEPPDVGSPSIVYHGSLALRSAISAMAASHILQITRSLESRPPVFFDVNLRSPWWSIETIRSWWECSDDVKLNAEEIELLVPEETSLEKRARRLLSDSGAQSVVVTLGEEGAVAFHADGRSERCSASTRVPVVDTVGAGDAFSSVLIAGRLWGWSYSDRLERAKSFAESVVGLRGAITRDHSFYRKFRESWDAA